MEAIATNLPSAVDETLTPCPRLRILVVGNTGVGKSSLISDLFNISLEDIDVAHDRAGKAEIEREYTSDENQHLILHDSQGFESGDTSNWEIINGFLQKRSATAELKDRVHVIWLCIETPRTGTREIETGGEKLLALANQLKIPVIVVFTKFDILVNEYAREAQGPRSHIESRSRERAEKQLKVYVKPWSKKQALCVRTSTKTGYQETLENLARITLQKLGGAEGEALPPSVFNQLTRGFDLILAKFPVKRSRRQQLSQQTSTPQKSEESLPSLVEQQPITPPGPLASDQQTNTHQSDGSLLPPEADQQTDVTQGLLLVWMIAQQASIQQKIEGSIRVVKAQYWINLGQSTVFSGHRLIECWSRISLDILKVWNFNDPDELLSHPDFLGQITQLVGEFSSDLQLHTNQERENLGASFISSAVSLAFIEVFKFLFEPYRAMPATARFLGAYIVDLTLVLRRIFVTTLTMKPPRAVSKRLIDEEIQNYQNLEITQVHRHLRDMQFGLVGFEGRIADVIRKSLQVDRVNTNPH